MAKKILFVIDVMRMGGGAQKVLLQMMRFLQERGHQIKLIVLKKTASNHDLSGFDAEYILDDETKTILSHLYMILDHLYTKAQKYDLLVSFMDFIVCYCVALTAKITYKPYYAFVRCESSFALETFSQPMINQVLYAHCLQGASKVICNSQSSLDDVIMNFGVDLKKTFLLHNPINIETTDHDPYPFKKPGDIFCLMAGRLHLMKNYSIVLKAFNHIQNQNIKLFIIGEGEIKDKLLALAKGNVEFLGYKTCVHDYVKKADIFIHASLTEGSPNAVLEAAMLHKPLILSSIKPHQEIFESKALFFDALDEYALKEHIELLSLDISLRNELGLKAFEAVQNFNETFNQHVSKIFG